MSLAENLLNSLDETAYENSRIAGFEPEEAHIVVGQDRVIIVPNNLKTIAVKGDKDIETVTFDCVRFWDENDLSTFAIYINYILPNGDEGTYIPKNIVKFDDIFTFDWEIGSEITYASGKLTFWIVAKLTDNDADLIKQWSSLQNSDCSIAQGGDRDKSYSPYEDGFKDGRKAEYDDFWDNFQNNGNATIYNHSFRSNWNSSIFKPKYDIRPTQATAMFSDTGISGNLKKLLSDLGVELDTSNATAVNSLFYGATQITHLGILDFSSATSLSSAFERASSLESIDKIILKNDGSQVLDMFSRAQSLKHVTFEGVIGQNGLNLQHSTELSKASITSIINCLSTTTSGLTVTLAKFAVNKAFETSEGANDGTTSAEWVSLIGTKSNWTISLV